MSKAIQGAFMIAGAIGLGAALFLNPALLATAPWVVNAMWALAAGGVGMEAGAIASALTSNRGQNITTRTPAGLRQIIYGEQRVGGVIVYQSTSGSHFWQMNMIIVLATHEVDAIENLYLDGRQVYWVVGSDANTTRNGVNFGGNADSNDHIGPGGPTYNFGSLVFCAARFGDQAAGDVIPEVAGNDPNWSTSALGNPPSLMGCAYVYLKLVYHSVTLPTLPEIRFTIRGKNNIYDPRTGTTGYSTNWALQVADVITDSSWGLGDNSVNQAQLIAAANVCDEQILTSQGYESNYAQSIHYDTSTAPGDALNMMMPSAGGRLSRVGGEWYIWPAYWQGPSFVFDASALIDVPSWTPYRSFKDLINRVNGTYTAANYPYNTAGNLYDSNGWWNGTTANNWPFAFQPTNFPQYAQDTLHGYSSDALLVEDGGVQLPYEMTLRGVLSIVQAQRVAKIHLLRNRFQGTGTFPMSLAAWQMIPTTVFQFSWPALNWSYKQLEVAAVRFKIEEVKALGSGDGDSGDESDKVPALSVELSVNETDVSIYEWSIGEELTPYDVPVAPVNGAYTPQPPTSLVIVSNGLTALTGADGVVTPRARLTWVPPNDSYVKLIQVQYKLSSSTTWLDAGTFDALSELGYVNGIISGQTYDFQIRSMRFNGAISVWVQDLGYTAGAGVLSVIPAAQVAGLSGAALGDASSLSSGTVAAARLPAALARINAAAATGLTVAAGAASQVGSGATATVSGSSLAGSVTLTTGTGTLAGGTICTVNFPSTLASAPNGVCVANGIALPDLGWTISTTQLTIAVVTPLAPSTTYTIEYSIA
jgi:hypothetical protein